MHIHTLKYFWVIFISIILNVHNDPCFEVVVSYFEILSGTLFQIKLCVKMRQNL